MFGVKLNRRQKSLRVPLAVGGGSNGILERSLLPPREVADTKISLKNSIIPNLSSEMKSRGRLLPPLSDYNTNVRNNYIILL